MRPGNVVLIGFMGSGKNVVGQLLAQRLGYGLVDTDALVAEEAGSSVAAIFESEGEQGFRAREADAVAKAVAGTERVIACGGGAILSLRNLRLLQDAGTIVYLRASADTLIKRLGDGAGRPLLRGDPKNAVPPLLAERTQAYRSAADLVVDTDDRTPQEVAAEIAQALGPPA